MKDDKKMMAEGTASAGGHAVKKPYPSNASIVALRFPDGVSKKIYADTKGISGAIKAGDHHVTMAYLGDDEMNDEAKMGVRRAMKMFAAGQPPLTDGSLNNGTGSFKMRKHGKPFYANFQAKGLRQMRDGLVSALGDEGIKMAGKPFVPHVTLAYLPEGTQTPQLDLDHEGLTFGSMYLKMGGGDYEEYPLSGEAKGYDMSGHVDAVRSAWSAKMRERFGDDWWDKGYSVEKVEDDAVITSKGGRAYRCPYIMDDGRVRFGEMQKGELNFIPTGETMGEYKMCTPKHARKMYLKMMDESDNRVLDVADGHVYTEKGGKYFKTAYSGDGDDVEFGEPAQVKMGWSAMDDEDDDESKAGRRIAAPRLSVLSKLKEQLMDAVAQLDQILTWGNYMDGTGKAFPDFLDVDRLAAWAAKAADLESIETPPMYLKAIKGKETAKGVVVGAYMMPWGAPHRRDLQGDYATKSTKFFEDYYSKAPALFHHGRDPRIGRRVLGQRDDAYKDDNGLWVQDWLKKSDDFWGMINALLSRKALYYSPGSVPHLVERTDDRELLTYPIVDDTITPTPILAPLLRREGALDYIKSAYDELGLTFTLPKDLRGKDDGKSSLTSNGKTNERELALALLKLKERVIDVTT